MLQTGVVDKRHRDLTDEDVKNIAGLLNEGDHIIVVFKEPSSSTPELVRSWHGHVVAPRGKDTRWRWISYVEGGVGVVYPFPPSSKDVKVLDVMKITVESLRRDAPRIYFPQQQISPGQYSATNSPSPPREPSLFPIVAETQSQPQPTAGDSASDANTSCIEDVRMSSTDLTCAMSQRLFRERKVLLCVKLPKADEPAELLSDLGLELIRVGTSAEAKVYVESHFATLMAIVTSSLREEFEGATAASSAAGDAALTGVELCQLVLKLRKQLDGELKTEMALPLAILCTKTIAMADAVEHCDIFVHAQNPLTAALKEISRRIAPPRVLWIKRPMSASLRCKIADENLSIHEFDTTFRAFQFLLACPWNVAAVVTDPCEHLKFEGHLTGEELGRRIKTLELSRFRRPQLILVGSHSPATDFDLVISPERSTGEQEAQILEHLRYAAKEALKHHCEKKPGAVVFGRGSNVVLSNTYPSPMVITIDGEEKTFPNVEQFFQAAKHYGTPLFDEIRQQVSVYSALQIAWKRKVSSRDWNVIRDDVMMFALYHKFKQEEFAKKLLATMGKDLIHATLSSEDTYWGDGGDQCSHRGMNRFGEMLMAVRQRLADKGADALTMRNPLRVLHETTSLDTRQFSTTSVFEINWRELLGRGAFGAVYAAREVHSYKKVAAKVASVDATSTEALRSEFQMLSSVFDNNIVRVLHADLRDGKEAVVYMEFMPDGSLESQAKVFRFHEPLIRRYVRQILDGLDALHRRYKIVHRDLKPGNVLLNGNTCKISDFGASILAEKSLGGPQAGTPVYMSPSRLSGHENEKYQYADDIWALGCIVVRLATGGPHDPWYEEGDERLLREQYWYQLALRMAKQKHPAIPEHLSEPAKAFVMACFTEDETHRPTAEQLLRQEWFRCGEAAMEPPEVYAKLRELHHRKMHGNRADSELSQHYSRGGGGTETVTEEIHPSGMTLTQDSTRMLLP